jgi:hypothetical protein
LSIDEATPSEWDETFKRIKEDRYYDNRPIPYAPSPDDHDNVEKPQHYRVGEVEAIDYIHQQLGSGVKDYLLGNVHKYLHRHRFKGQAVEDLRKAEWYLRKLIMEECNL